MIVKKAIRTRAGELSVLDRAGSERRTLVFLHGNSGTKALFRHQLGALDAHWRFLAIDLAGHGESEDASQPEDHYTIAGHAKSVADVLDALQVSQFAVLGASLGGHVALELSAIAEPMGCLLVGAPPFAKSVEGISAAFLPGPAMELSVKAELSKQDVETFLSFHDPLAPTDREIFAQAIVRADGRARSLMAQHLLSSSANDQLQLAERLRGRTSFVLGSADTAINRDYVARVMSNLGGNLAIVDGAGHAPYLTHPEAFNTHLAAFVASVAD